MYGSNNNIKNIYFSGSYSEKQDANKVAIQRPAKKHNFFIVTITFSFIYIKYVKNIFIDWFPTFIYSAHMLIPGKL